MRLVNLISSIRKICIPGIGRTFRIVTKKVRFEVDLARFWGEIVDLFNAKSVKR